jgi:hypothetical protein
MTHPRRSTRITGLPRYHGAVRPCASHRYSAPRGFRRLESSRARPTADQRCATGRRPRETTGSHVPHRTLRRARATFMPDTTWAVDRYPPSSSRDIRPASVLMPSEPFDTSSVVHSRSPSRLAPDALNGAPFPATLTTPALDRRSLRWFAASPCRAAAEGHTSISDAAPHHSNRSSTSMLLQRSWSHDGRALLGVPVAVKDVVDVAGRPRRWAPAP